jgi:hypothetical protein
MDCLQSTVARPNERLTNNPSSEMDGSSESASAYSQLVNELERIQAAITASAEINSALLSSPEVSGIPQRNHKRLSPLEERHNWVMKRLASLSHGTPSDPLDILPQEIWEKNYF